MVKHVVACLLLLGCASSGKERIRVVFRAEATQTVDWPDDKVYRIVFGGGDKSLSQMFDFEVEQIAIDSTLGIVATDRLPLEEGVDYWIARDTFFLNVPTVRKRNPLLSDDYAYKWRIRFRPRNLVMAEKRGNWIYTRKILNLRRTR